MSASTNPNPGGHGDKDSLGATLWMSMTGASAGDHHEEQPGFDAASKQVGHEPDQFSAKTIVFVPILVAIALVLVYAVVQGTFLFVTGTSAQQKDDPNWNERAGRIATYEAEAIPPKAGSSAKPEDPVPQARLEYIREIDLSRKDVNGNTVTDPPYLRSFASTPTGNSPEIYPEDLRAENYVDPTTRTRPLAEASWVSKDKNVATIPIDEAIHLVAHDAKYKLKVSATPATPALGTQGKPKMSSGGLTPPKAVDVLAKKGEVKDDHGHK